MMRKGGTSSAPTTPRGGLHARASQPTQLAEEHHIVATTFVQADVNTFREVVQKLTGPPSPLPRTPTGSAAASERASNGGGEAKEPSPPSLRRDGVSASARLPELERVPSLRPLSGPGPQRSNTTKLLERRRNAKNLEVKQLMGPHILKRTISPALSPVSPLTTNVFDNSGATSPLGYMGYAPASTPPAAPTSPFELAAGASSQLELATGAARFELGSTRASSYDVGQASPSSFDLNGGICRLDLAQCTPSPREPRLLPLFPLHSPRSLSS